MKFTLRLLLLLTSTLIFIQGCYRDEIIITTNPSNLPHKLGVYVLSEGTQLPNQSVLSFLSYANGDYNLNITFPDLLGISPDGLIYYNNKFYITAQGSPGGQGKIYAMDTNGIITGSNNFGINPYSLTAVLNKAYCTNGPDSSVSVIDLNTLSEIKRIKVGIYPQEIISSDLKVFVCNTRNISSGAVDSTISVININTDIEIAKIKINYAPSSIALSKDGFLLIGSSGSNGIIYKISPFTYAKVDSFVVNSPMIKDISIDYLADDIYFISSPGTITKLNLRTRAQTVIISGSPLVTAYGYTYDWKSKQHYVADAVNYTTNGFLYRYNYEGTMQSLFQTREKPRRILIRN